MKDWWNDPPDGPESPECCGEIMEVDGKGNLICDYCGKFIQPQPDSAYDTLEEKEEAYGEPIEPATCPHGRECGDCEKCDFESDIAYDAARERRMK